MSTFNSINNTCNSGLTISGGTVSIDSGTNTLGISTDSNATTLSIGTGNAVKGVTLGSTNTTSTTTLQAGSGGVKLGTSAAGVVVTNSSSVLSSSNGTSGQVLTSNGAGNAPTFQNGGLVLIQTLSATSSASLVFSTGITATYKSYAVIIDNIIVSAAGTALLCDLSTDGGSTYITSGYASAYNYTNLTTGLGAGVGGLTSHFMTLNVQGPSTTLGLNATGYLYNMTNASYPSSTVSAVTNAASTSYYINFGSVYTSAATVNALKFYISGDTIASGTISLYGIVQ